MSCHDTEANDLNENQFLSDIEETKDTNIVESTKNHLTSDRLADISLDKLHESFTVKPEHWTDEYWKTITSTYKWFIHKEGYGGCSICFVNKVYLGKKSLLASIRLKLMELSYADFEKKLSYHEETTQHTKSVSIYSRYYGKSNAPEIIVIDEIVSKPSLVVNIAKRMDSPDYPCPMCDKVYKFKKVLAKHVLVCNENDDANVFQFPCDCESRKLRSIRSIDEHNQNNHLSKFCFKCHCCTQKFTEATILFGHLLQAHDYQWNPCDFMPEIEEVKDAIAKPTKSNARAIRKKSYAKNDDIWYRYDVEEEINLESETKLNKKRKIEKVEVVTANKYAMALNASFPNSKLEKGLLNEKSFVVSDRIINTNEDYVRSNNKFDKVNERYEVSQLALSVDQIHTCEYCGGRYLSANILNEHIKTRHLIDDADNDSENLVHKYRKKLLQIAESLNNPSSRTYTKRKAADNTNTITCSDNTISPCLLSCPLCQESFLSLDSRNEHVANQHPEIEQFVCHQCGLIFTNHNNYCKHLENSHNGNALPKSHKNNEHVTTYSCTNCPLVFTNNADLNNHMYLSHPSMIKAIPSTDIDCEDIETTEIPQNHETTENLETAEILIKDDIKEASNLLEIVKSEADVANESINTNEKCANTLASLIDADPLEKETTCADCGLVCHNAFEGVVHGLSHVEDGRDVVMPSCPNCNRLFFGDNAKNYLKDHYSVDHLKKSGPQCIICSMSLSSSFALEKHQVNGLCLTTEVEEPYQALMEEQRFAFSCPQCGLIFAGDSASQRLDNHNKTCASDLMDDDEFLDS